MTDHEYIPSLNPMDQGDCAICGNSRGWHTMTDHDFQERFGTGNCRICGGAPSTRPEHTSPRARFNAAVLELGLTVDHTTTDGWHRSFSRPDGLHLWRIVDFRLGCGIQTAYAQGDRYVNHKPYYVDGDVEKALREAVKRDLPTP